MSDTIRVYVYGCLPPIEGGDALDEQFWRAHRYRNALVEIERERRAAIAAAQRDHDTLGPLLAAIDSTETTIAEGRRELRLLQSGGKGERRQATEERAGVRELVEAAQADLSVLRWLRAWHKTATRDELRPAYQTAQLAANERRKVVRKGADAPAWGTYQAVEAAAKDWGASAEPPRFERYQGTGRVAVHFQGDALTVDELMRGESNFFRLLSPRPIPVPEPTSPRQIQRAIAYGVVAFCRCGNMVRDSRRETCSRRRHEGTMRTPLHHVRIRVASDEDKQPVWVTLPLVYDRPLPADAEIKWAWIYRHRDGVRYRYELQIVVEAPSHRPMAPPQTGRVAIDIGARDLADGTVRTAYWLDDAGRSGEIVSALTRLSSPTSRGARRRRAVLDDDRKVEDVRSIRDRHLDVAKVWLSTFRSMAPTDEVREKMATIRTWRSPSRMVLLRRLWNAAGGDLSVVAAIDAYIAKDRHLLDWESRERRRRELRQREQFRVFAAHVARAYSEIVIADRDYRRKSPAPENGISTQGHGSRVIFRRANPGKLREELMAAAKAGGARITVVDLDGDAPECLNRRVCERLLASGEAMIAQASPLAQRDRSGKPAKRVRRRLGTAATTDPLAGQDVTIGNGV